MLFRSQSTIRNPQSNHPPATAGGSDLPIKCAALQYSSEAPQRKNIVSLHRKPRLQGSGGASLAFNSTILAFSNAPQGFYNARLSLYSVSEGFCKALQRPYGAP